MKNIKKLILFAIMTLVIICSALISASAYNGVDMKIGETYTKSVTIGDEISNKITLDHDDKLTIKFIPSFLDECDGCTENVSGYGFWTGFWFRLYRADDNLTLYERGAWEDGYNTYDCSFDIDLGKGVYYFDFGFSSDDEDCDCKAQVTYGCILKNSDYNGVAMKSGKTYTKSIAAYDTVSNKITLNHDGMLTINFTPTSFVECDDCSYWGGWSGLWIRLYSAANDEFSLYEEGTGGEFYINSDCSVTLGLEKGVYYFDFGVSSESFDDCCCAAQVNYGCIFKKSSSCETENNNYEESADPISLGKMYKAHFTNFDYEYDSDYYSVDLIKGKYYTLKVDNFTELSNLSDGCADYIFEINDKKHNEIDIDWEDYKKSGNTYSWRFKAPSTGTFYIFADGLWLDREFCNVDYGIGIYLEKTSASDYPASLSTTTYTYNGNNRTPKVTIKTPSGQLLVKNTDYTLSTPSKRADVGEYTVKITYIGSYTGSKELTFKIVPAKTAITSLTSAEKSITVNWTKQATQTTGYEIQYSKNSDFSSSKTVSVTKNSTVSKQLTGLNSDQKYYVRIRTYKLIGDTRYRSGWSAAKSVTTKKSVGIKPEKESLMLYLGGTHTPAYTVYPSGVTVKWSSDNKSVVTVSSSGKLTAVKAGTANITASFVYKSKTYKATIKVTVKTPTITLNKTSATIYTGDQLYLSATTAPTKAKVYWKTSNSSVATVSSSGVVTAKKSGTATITGYIKYASKTYSKTCKVTVKYQDPISITYVDWYTNSAGGVEPEITIRNNTNKTIKYIYMDTYYKNRFGDPAYCEIRDSYYRELYIEEGLGAKQTLTFYWDPVLYNDHVSRIDFEDITVVFIDNTSTTFNMDTYWYDSNYYYQ